MLATFVIGLREGLEASLIVGIIASFLAKQGRRDALRQVWSGVGIAVAICLAVGVGLKLASQDLPQRQQEGLETVIGAAAVAMVTYMVVWMKRHSRDLKGQLESAAGSALVTGSATALVAMAFLAVLREGLETAVFLLAAFNASTSSSDAAIGAALGIAVAVGLGYGIYRGGVHINLSKFFRATGLVLVLVAGGLVVTALHTAHEAGWLQAGQRGTFDLSWLVAPGSVRSSLLTGMLGLQPRPVAIEVAGWLLYVIPLGLYVAWPAGRRVSSRRLSTVLAATAGAAALAAAVVPVTAPGSPARDTSVGAQAATSSSVLPGAHVPEGTVPAPARGATGSGSVVRDGVTLTRITQTSHGVGVGAGIGLPTTLSEAQLVTLGHGRLPIGLNAADLHRGVTATYARTVTTTWLVEPTSGVLVSAVRRTTWSGTVSAASGTFPVGTVASQSVATTPSAQAASLAAAARLRTRIDRHRLQARVVPATLCGAALLLLLLGLAAAVADRRRLPAAVRRQPGRRAPALASQH
jgi:high-affinity iron transporter